MAGTGFEGVGTVTNMTAAQFDWVLPPGADENSTSATAVTDAAGFATFQWTPTNPTITSDFEVVESSDVPGVTPVLGTCTFRTPDTPDTDFPFEVIEDAGGNPIGFALRDIPPESIITCQITNIVEPVAAMAIEKYTNGVDADDPPGPFISVGEPVEWTYVVTNTGNLTLSTIAITDSDPDLAIACPRIDALPPGQRLVCRAVGTAEPGQYANVATATAVDSWGNDVGPVTDPSHYFGDIADLEIEKYTVVPSLGLREDADAFIDADGNVIAPLVPVGTPVTWEYEVTNPDTSTATVESIVVDDSEGVAVTCPTDTLGPGGTMTCTADVSVPAVAGAYSNLGTVSGIDPVGPGPDDDIELTDADPAHYLGYEFSVDIVKYTNGRDANAPDGSDAPIILAGDPVTWTYEVTNTGNVPLTDLSVTDDQGVEVTCPSDAPDPLIAGATIVCSASGTAIDTGPDEPYANVGTVVAEVWVPPGVTLPPGHPLIGATVDASDPSHYIGLDPSITIEKATNGDDADEPTGPYVPVGDTVDWTYVVTNTGSAPLTDIIAVDYRAGGGVTTLDCEQDALDPGEDMECAIPPGVATPGQFVNYSGVVGTDPFGRRVADTDPSHHFGAEPGIHLKKYTNGLDADEPPGPYIAVDDPVEWTYVVTNTGNNTLQSIVVTDDPAQAITCPGDTLAPAGEMTCTATGVAARGQYENMATVVGEDSVGQTVTDTDPSHYFGFLAAIDIEKATNGEDADQPTGPLLPVGSEVTWTYVVTNPGDVPILNVDVTDDQGALPVFQGGDANGDDLLDPGETWTYEATGTVELGQYENLSTATGFAGFELGIPVSATDPSHYLGVEGAIRIEKTPDSAEVPRGNSHTFTIEVTNVGSVDLTDVVVTDLVVPACDRDIGDLGAGETVTYECAVDEVFETIENTAVVKGTVPDGSVVTDEDSATVTPVDTGGTAEIGDTVWSDLDSNGVQDAGEPGIAGARVRIVTVSETVDPQAAGDELQLQVDVTLVTDANGRYLQPALVAGTYKVTLDLASVDGNLTTAASFVIPLRAGESRLDADFGVVLSQISGEDSDDGTDAADPDDDRDLPLTGLEILRLVAVAMLLLALGSGTVLFTRLPPGAEPPSAEGP